MKQRIIYVIDSTDFHAIDWYRMVKKICKTCEVMIATDTLAVNKSDNIINNDDKILKLLLIQKYLTSKKTVFSNIYRNIIKLLALPVQILQLRRLKKKYPNSIFHAHSMYYIFLCWAARIKAIATPMGSDVLVRPDESKIYKFFTSLSLNYADKITVDSQSLVNKIIRLTGKDSYLIQNGINTSEILSYRNKGLIRKNISSIRGFYPNYQITEILNSRNLANKKYAINFIYPFFELKYKNEIKEKFIKDDLDLGRLSKNDLYKNLWMTNLAISVPISDSSPRTVYEAIFCGCVVAVTKSEWINSLPSCMKKRIIEIDINDKYWFTDALEKSNHIIKNEYFPSEEAINKFDEEISMRNLCKNIYNLNLE